MTPSSSLLSSQWRTSVIFYHHQTNFSPRLPLSFSLTISLYLIPSAYYGLKPCLAKHLCSVLCCLHASSVSHSDSFFSSPYGLNTLLLLLSTQISLVLHTTCHWLKGCTLCNTNTGCYHNDWPLLRLLPLLWSWGWPWSTYTSMFVLAPQGPLFPAVTTSTPP